uniref:HAMP domain-containing protein n=1 Tax=Rheinheimera sp. TaxID=1869214 RepID=UPI0040487160
MSGLRRLSIKQRLFINGIALVAAMVVMLLILFYQSSKLTSLATTQQLVEQIAADVLMLRRAEKDFLLRKDLAYQQQFASIVAQLTSQIAADGDSGRLIQQYQRSFEALVSASQQMGLDETQGVTGVMRKAIQSTEESLKALQTQTNEAISSAVKTTQQLALLVFALVLAAVLLLVALTSRSILRPVLDVCKTIGLIRSQNDFRMRVDVSGKDEMTALATDFNSMLGDFQDLIRMLFGLLPSKPIYWR